MKNQFLLLALLALPGIAEAGIRLKSKGAEPNYLYEKDSKALASSVQLVFRTGSLADPKGKEGLSQLAFRSLLGATKKRSKEDFQAAVERLGASISIDVGAGRTILSVDALSDNLEPALLLLAEAVLEPGLVDEDINAIRSELLAGVNQELSNNRRILRRIFRQAIFRNTALAFPPEGTLSGLNNATNEDVRAFIASQLKAKEVIFAVSSNRSEAEVKGWIEKAFAKLPEGSAPALAMPSPEKIEGRTVFVMDRPGSTTTEIAIGHHGILANNRDRDTLETGLFAFGEDMTSRLFQELREKKGWTYGAAAGFDLFERPRRYPGAFLVWSFPQAEHTQELVLRALEIYEDYAKKGLTAKELSFAQKSLGNSYPFKFATSRSRLTARLYELLENAPHHGVAEYRGIVNGVTRGSLRSAIRKAHNAENVAIVLVGDPERTKGLLTAIPKVKNVVRITDPLAAF